MFLTLNLWWREASGDNHGGKGRSYPEAGRQRSDWGCGSSKNIYRLGTLGQAPASTWNTEYSAFLASGKRYILQIAVDWPLSHSTGGTAGPTSVSYLSFSCSTCDFYSWPAQLLDILLRPTERKWVVLVILSVDLCLLGAGARLSGHASGPGEPQDGLRAQLLLLCSILC